MLEVRGHRWSMKQPLIFELQPFLLFYFYIELDSSGNVLDLVVAQSF
jgi:hypothetical protein